MKKYGMATQKKSTFQRN